MTTRLLATAVLLLSGIGATESLLACGEKFLNGLRSPLHLPPPARSSASILVYANPAFNLSKAVTNGSVEATLTNAGYRPTMVASRGEFDAMMRSVQWDLVLVDVADSGSVITRAPNSNPPRILSIVYKPSKDELKAAKKQYWRILETPTKNQRFLEEIDWALAAKPPASPKARGSSGR